MQRPRILIFTMATDWPAAARLAGALHEAGCAVLACCPERAFLSATRYLDHAFAPHDVLLFGRESSGVADEVHAAADVRLQIPIRPGLRSLNVAMTCAMAVGEALRQSAATGG